MKVLFVIHHLKMGGAETIVTNYALQMKKMGIEVAVLDIWHFNTILFRKLQNANIPVFSIFKESNIITRIINIKAEYLNFFIFLFIKYFPDFLICRSVF